MKTVTVSVSASSRSLSSRRKSGDPDHVFFALPRDGGGYKAWVRPDDIEGARLTGRVSFELRLPVGTLRKTVRRDIQRSHLTKVGDFTSSTFSITGLSDPRRSTTEVDRLAADGHWESLKFLENKKIANGWLTVIELDGQRVEV